MWMQRPLTQDEREAARKLLGNYTKPTRYYSVRGTRLDCGLFAFVIGSLIFIFVGATDMLFLEKQFPGVHFWLIVLLLPFTVATMLLIFFFSLLGEKKVAASVETFRNAISEDLERGVLEVERFLPSEVYKERDVSVYYFRLSKSRAICLSDAIAYNVINDELGFPNSDFEIRRFPRTKIILWITCFGSKMEPKILSRPITEYSSRNNQEFYFDFDAHIV